MYKASKSQKADDERQGRAAPNTDGMLQHCFRSKNPRAPQGNNAPSLDGVEPGFVSEICHSAEHVKGIKEILDVKARWLRHKLHTDIASLLTAARE